MLPDQIKRFITDSNKGKGTVQTQNSQADGSIGNIGSVQHASTGLKTQEKEIGQTSSQQLYASGKQARNDINMEAYNAYYNNHNEQTTPAMEGATQSPS